MKTVLKILGCIVLVAAVAYGVWKLIDTLRD